MTWIKYRIVNHKPNEYEKDCFFIAPGVLSTQSIHNDLYYVPSKKKEETVEKKKTLAADAVVVKTNAPTTVYASPGNTTIVVKDRKGNIRDVDEYNRRYDSKNYEFSQENDTLYIDEKEYDGIWQM